MSGKMVTLPLSMTIWQNYSLRLTTSSATLANLSRGAPSLPDDYRRPTNNSLSIRSIGLNQPDCRGAYFSISTIAQFTALPREATEVSRSPSFLSPLQGSGYAWKSTPRLTPWARNVPPFRGFFHSFSVLVITLYGSSYQTMQFLGVVVDLRSPMTGPCGRAAPATGIAR